MADVESKSIPHELPSSHWLKATGQCVLERYLSATMESPVPKHWSGIYIYDNFRFRLFVIPMRKTIG